MEGTRRAQVLERAGLYVVEQRPVAEAPDWWPSDWVVALVHGAMDRSAGLARVARRLPEFSLVRYDRRGYGHSVGRGPGTLRDHTDDLFTVLDGRRGLIVGHSFGGAVALAAAVRAPAQVRAVLTYEAPTPWEPWWPTWSPTDGFEAAEDPAGDAAEVFLRATIGDALWERLPARTRAARRAEGASMVAEVASIQGPDAPIDLRAIAVPVVSVHGSKAVQRHARAARQLADDIRLGESVTLVGAGHGAPLSHPTELADLVRHAARRAAEGR